MRRMLSVLTTTLLCGLILGLLSVVAPAASAASGSIWSNNGVLYDTCRYHSYSYSVSPDSSDWELDVDLIAPDGTNADFDFLYSGSDPMSGKGWFQFCGWEMAGRYKIKAVLTWYDEEFNDYQYTLPTAYFSMRKPRTRTSLRVSDSTPHFNEVVRFRSKTKDERPAGYFGTSYGELRLQYRTRTGWRNVRGSRTYANENGVAVWRYRWNFRGTLKLRARTLPAPEYKASSSTAKKIVTTRERPITSRTGRSVPGILG